MIKLQCGFLPILLLFHLTAFVWAAARNVAVPASAAAVWNASNARVRQRHETILQSLTDWRAETFDQIDASEIESNSFASALFDSASMLTMQLRPGRCECFYLDVPTASRVEAVMAVVPYEVLFKSLGSYPPRVTLYSGKERLADNGADVGRFSGMGVVHSRLSASRVKEVLKGE